MARDAVVQVAATGWTELTDASITGNVSVANLSDTGIVLAATEEAGGSPAVTDPTNEDWDGFPLPYIGNGFSKATIAEMFPGAGATPLADRLWARAVGLTSGTAPVRISYA